MPRTILLLAFALLACGQAGLPSTKPQAVFVHGGGWHGGTPAAGDFLAGWFGDRGFAFRAIDYRKPPAVRLGDSVADVAAAARTAAQAGPLTLVGHSAGAHLAAAAALGRDAPPVACLMLLDGIGYDLSATLRERPGLEDRTGLTADEAAPLSPTALAAATARRPAVLLAAGGDARGTAAQAQAFAAVLRRFGFDVTLALFPEARHADFLRDFAVPDSAIARAADAFLAQHPACHPPRL
ncbi:alpha/beta hydrolase fold domain-containing protein [Sphingomonas sp.]|uniref:alpha/beta hydrolase fold domain-containing protein n=1 Tax=Sphingomonas sp. TaxID=28214 RepID=UPI0035C7B5B2